LNVSGGLISSKRVCVGVLLKKGALDMPQKELWGPVKNLKFKNKDIKKQQFMLMLSNNFSIYYFA
jgi:hypothetical protein